MQNIEETEDDLKNFLCHTQKNNNHHLYQMRIKVLVHTIRESKRKIRYIKIRKI